MLGGERGERQTKVSQSFRTPQKKRKHTTLTYSEVENFVLEVYLVLAPDIHFFCFGHQHLATDGNLSES